MSTEVARAGTRVSRVATSPRRTLELLADPAFVTEVLGDLLDQQRSSGEAPVRWTLPRLHVGTAAVEIVLAPRWQLHADRVVVHAVTTEEADAHVELRLTCVVAPDGNATSVTFAWTLRLDVPLPRMLIGLARPALDRGIGQVVEDILRRIVDGVESV